jgi:hypothetical protein
LETVRAMVEHGAALAVMGNHELNAIAYHTRDPRHPERFLRDHSVKNVHQHFETLRQLPALELYDYVDWFRTLPLWIEADGMRVVHACWDPPSLEVIQRELRRCGGTTLDFIEAASRHGSPLFEAVEAVLKGKELPLPEGVAFADKDGHLRHTLRVKWYAVPQGHTIRSYAFPPHNDYPDMPLPDALVAAAQPYPADAPPVFVGHYWLKAERPERLAANVACLDYSVARGGFLCAYRWQGERELANEHFVFVNA